MVSMDVEMVVDEGAGSATITVSTAEDIDFAFELKYETAPGIVVPEAVGDARRGLRGGGGGAEVRGGGRGRGLHAHGGDADVRGK